MVETAAEQAARADFFRPGNIVKLKEPYKPENDSELQRAVGLLVECAVRYRWKAWKDWDGFTHGIIVEVVSTQWSRVTGTTLPHTVSLLLYGPQFSLLYMGPNQIPCYTDFSVDELIPWADTKQLGYVVSDWATEDADDHG